MQRRCIKRVSGILTCVMTGAVFMSALADQYHPEHLPDPGYQTSPIRTTTTNSGTISGASGASGDLGVSGSLVQNQLSLGTLK